MSTLTPTGSAGSGTWRTAVGVFVLLGAISGCGAQAPPAADAIGRVGDSDLFYAQFDEFLRAQLGDSTESLDSVVLSRLLDQFLDETLLFRFAQSQGLVDESSGRLDALAELMAAAVIEEPTAEEIERYYHGHAQEFERKARVRLRQLLIDEKALAEQAATKLDAGADFAEVARRYSEGPSGPYGGDEGVLAYEDLPELFSSAIIDLQPGEVSDLVETEYGLHIFQVLERLPASNVPIDQATDEIRQRLTEQRAATYLDDLVSRVRRQYNVEIYAQNLPFDYRGSYRAQNGSSS